MSEPRRDRIGMLSANLRKLLNERQLTQVELATRAKLDRSYLSSLVNASARSYPKTETLERLARALNVELGELTGRESLRQITPYEANPQYRKLIDILEQIPDVDRQEVIRQATWTAERIRGPIGAVGDSPVDNVIHFPSHADADGDFPPLPIAPEDFIEKDTDAPRPLHAWIVPIDAEAAAGVPRNPDDILVPTTQLLNTFREVRDDRTHVIKIIGHSMHPTLRNGWKVLIDPARSLFQPGKIVMVYLRDEGSTIGMLARDGERMKIVKRNADYGGPVEILLRPGEWYPVGTVTTIVEAPVEIE